jgi:hypothetical protein
MKVQELRIGNLVEFAGINYKVETIDLAGYIGLSDIILFEQLHIDDLKPINLTEERLIKFGFKIGNIDKLRDKHYVIRSGPMDIIISGVGFWDVYTIYNPFNEKNKNLNIITNNIGLDYLHQLQNLHFALTGKEL